MADVTYGVYLNNGSTDGTAVVTEDIDTALADHEVGARIGQLFDRAVDTTTLEAGKNWVIKPTAVAV